MTNLFPQLHIIGITGKIGSGKSTVARFLEEKGATRIDCDQLVYDLYEPEGMGTKKIQTFFGETYLTKEGRVSRKKMLKTLVKSPKKWQILNRMIHPLVAVMLQRKLRAVVRGMVALEIQIYDARLFGKFIDELWVIVASETVRKERVKERGLSSDELDIISRQQVDPRQDAWVIFPNEGGRAELEQKVLILFEKNLLKH